ncbi:MAG: hypothetical protein ACI9TO_000022 [Rickettsiales bacterium]|jgi:hypothetical protein
MKHHIIPVIISISLFFISHHANAKQTYLGDDISYFDVKEYKGNVDLIQSAHDGIFVSAYRLMNGLGMPDKNKLKSQKYHSYNNFGSEWQKKVKNILDINNSSWRRCISEFTMNLLDERINKLGISHQYLKDWIKNQELVFDNCQYNSPLSLPNSYKTKNKDSDILKNFKKYDHQYQKASAYFYARKFDESIAEYSKITLENNSPYRSLSYYMIARSLIQKGNEDGAYDKIQQILKNDQLTEVHQYSRDLLAVLANKSGDSKYHLAQLEQILNPLLKEMKTDEDRKFLEDEFKTINYNLWYYLSFNQGNVDSEIFAKFDMLDWILTFTVPGMYIKDTSWGDKISDNCDENCDDDSKSMQTLGHSIDKWHQTKKLHWLIVVALRIPQNHQFQEEYLSTFKVLNDKVKNNKASDEELYAYPTIIHHAVRLMLNAKKYDEAEAIINSSLNYQKEFAPRIAFHSAKFLIAAGESERAQRIINAAIKQDEFINAGRFYNLKQILAKDLDELILVSTKSLKDRGKYYSPSIDDSLANIINLLPLDKIVQISNNKLLPAEKRSDLKLVAWTRSILLKRYDVADNLTSDLKKEIPQLLPYLERYSKAKNKIDKQKAATYLFLKNPRVRPYIYPINYYGDYLPQDSAKLSKFETIDVRNHTYNNWWCAIDPDELLSKAKEGVFNQVKSKSIFESGSFSRSGYYRNPPAINNTKFLKTVKDLADKYPIFKLVDYKELEELQKTGHATQYLVNQSVMWYKNKSSFSKMDKLLPEALHRAVKVTRYGCSKDQNKEIFSRKAFKTLHYNYDAENEWIKKTPYWFGYGLPSKL